MSAAKKSYKPSQLDRADTFVKRSIPHKNRHVNRYTMVPGHGDVPLQNRMGPPGAGVGPEWRRPQAWPDWGQPVGANIGWDRMVPISGPVSDRILWMKEDQKWKARSDLQDTLTQQQVQQFQQDGTLPGVGQVQLGSDFFDYLEKKRQLSLYNEYKKFVYNQIDLSEPQKRDYWQKLFPEFVNDKMEAMEHISKMKERVNLINIRGIQNMNDMLVKWMWDSGRMDQKTQDYAFLFQPKFWYDPDGPDADEDTIGVTLRQRDRDGNVYGLAQQANLDVPFNIDNRRTTIPINP